MNRQESFAMMGITGPLSMLWLAFVLASNTIGAEPVITNSLGMKLVRIEAGSFLMGQADGQYDERPVHQVALSRPFYMSAMEVTNAQYEQFDPKHRELRGMHISQDDEEAVVNVSWHDAMRFCAWLSEKEGKPYRLPSEAEWEYACRAGTATPYHTGSELPAAFHKSQKPHKSPSDQHWEFDLKVGRTPPNAWGLYDMHGNVEEWCLDWYGPYPGMCAAQAQDWYGPCPLVDSGRPETPVAQTDPAGCREGIIKVTRGGSYGTALEFLRSANRMGMLPEDRHLKLGFRVIIGQMPDNYVQEPEIPLCMRNVSQEKYTDWKKDGPDPAQPFFSGPREYVRIGKEADGPVYFVHNHYPSVVACPNGDLLAIWYTSTGDASDYLGEGGRKLNVAGARLRRGNQQWDKPSLFYATPDRNDHAPTLWIDDNGRIYHFQGVGSDSSAHKQVLFLRTSDDNGATWTTPRIIDREPRRFLNPNKMLCMSGGEFVLTCDHGNMDIEGHALCGEMLLSRDGGKSWGATGPVIAGLHPQPVLLKNGTLMIVGRDGDWGCYPPVEGDGLPVSFTRDLGKTWTYQRLPLPKTAMGQRSVLLRLREGPLLYIGFTSCKRGREYEGMEFEGPDGQRFVGYGMFAAISVDEGHTWPVKRLLTPGGPKRCLAGGGNTGDFDMDETHAEPRGYLFAIQTLDGVVQLLTSQQHYQFNYAWLNEPVLWK